MANENAMSVAGIALICACAASAAASSALMPDEASPLPDDTAFAMFLIKEVGVATVPGSSFYAHPELGRTKIRFCFPKTDDVLLDAGQRLQRLPPGR